MNDEQNPANERVLFLAALEQPNDAERAAYLDAACGSDAKLRAAVDALLKNHSDDSFMGVAAAEQVETLGDVGPPAEAVGTTMGSYKLLEKLGEGGFGTVWAAATAKGSVPVFRSFLRNRTEGTSIQRNG